MDSIYQLNSFFSSASAYNVSPNGEVGLPSLDGSQGLESVIKAETTSSMGATSGTMEGRSVTQEHNKKVTPAQIQAMHPYQDSTGSKPVDTGAISTLDQLPTEIIKNIFKYLSPQDRKQLGTTAVGFYAIQQTFFIKRKVLVLNTEARLNEFLKIFELLSAYNYEGLETLKSFSKPPSSLKIHSISDLDGATFKKIINLITDKLNINIHKVKLDFLGKISDRDLDELEILPSLETIKLSFCEYIKGTFLKNASKFRNLKSLDLYSCGLTELGVQAIGNLINLENISLRFCYGIDDIGLKHLGSLKNLKILELDCCSNITRYGFEYLSLFTNLITLKLKKLEDIYDSGMAAIGKLIHLESLEIESSASSHCDGITDLGLQSIQGLKSLKVLYMGRCNSVTNDGLEHLSALLQLQDLKIDLGSNITNEGFAHISKLIHLERLDLSNSKGFIGERLIYLKDMPKLTQLILADCEINRTVSLIHISKLQHLEILDLNNCSDLTDRDILLLKNMFQLKELDLSFNGYVTDTGLSHLQELNQLKHLVLRECHGITDAGLKFISKLENLEYLSLRGSSTITDKGLEHLKGLTRLTKLSIGFCKVITQVGIQAFKLSHPHCELCS